MHAAPILGHNISKATWLREEAEVCRVSSPEYGVYAPARQAVVEYVGAATLGVPRQEDIMGTGTR